MFRFPKPPISVFNRGETTGFMLCEKGKDHTREFLHNNNFNCFDKDENDSCFLYKNINDGQKAILFCCLDIDSGLPCWLLAYE